MECDQQGVVGVSDARLSSGGCVRGPRTWPLKMIASAVPLLALHACGHPERPQPVVYFEIGPPAPGLRTECPIQLGADGLRCRPVDEPVMAPARLESVNRLGRPSFGIEGASCQFDACVEEEGSRRYIFVNGDLVVYSKIMDADYIGITEGPEGPTFLLYSVQNGTAASLSVLTFSHFDERMTKRVLSSVI